MGRHKINKPALRITLTPIKTIVPEFKFSLMRIKSGEKIHVTLELGDNNIRSTLSGQVKRIYKDSFELLDTKLNLIEVYMNKIKHIKKIID